MSDAVTPALPRVALVFGEEAGAARLREAIRGHADIVYAASAGEFDAPRMLGAQATAALVNLDGGDWLEGIEMKLNDAGVAVVFNDPDISDRLEGWERARWLRHLVAKLSGSRDIDPPRPATSGAAAAPPAIAADAVVAPPPEVPASPIEGAAAERPLTPREIETMTADFVAEPEHVQMSLEESATASPETDAAAEPDRASVIGVDAEAEGLPTATAEWRADAPPQADAEAGWQAQPPAESEGFRDVAAAPGQDFMQADMVGDARFEPDGAPDVDTEALSAMIDARLADREPREPSGWSQVWRVAPEGNPAQAQFETLAGTDPATPDTVAAGPPAPVPATTPPDDADVLAGLPSLDDWQLVDPELPVEPAAAGHKQPEPELPDSVAGLKLEPIEAITPVRKHVEPVERWMHGEPRGTPKHADRGASGKSATHGGRP